MTFDKLVADGIVHMGAGVILALADFITSNVSTSQKNRIEQKTECLRSVELLLDAEAPGSEADGEREILSKDSVEYAAHVGKVRDYLAASGLMKMRLPFATKIKEGVRHFVYHEKINTMHNLNKFLTGVGIEIAYDVLIEFPYKGISGIAATLYQAPLFFAGLWLGNAGCGLVRAMSSGEERTLDKTIRRLVEETNIVDIVLNYAPSEDVKEEMHSAGQELIGVQLSLAGKKLRKGMQQIADTAKQAAEQVTTYQERKREEEEKEKEDRKKRFDDLTKGR